MNKLFEIPFHVDYLHNNAWFPEKEKPKYVSQEEYDKCVQEYDLAERKVLFKNTHVQFESCECGGEYGCSHKPYPYLIKFDNNEDIEALFEDYGFYIQNKKGYIRFDNEKEVSIGHFIVACELLGIKLEMTDFCLTLNNFNLTICNGITF